MKKLFCILLVAASATSWADNQIEFDLGRGSPESYVQAGGSSEHQGIRGNYWSANIYHQTTSTVLVGFGGGYFHSGNNISSTFAPNTSTTIHSHATDVLLMTRVNLSQSTKFTPYALLGGGWVKNSIFATASNGVALIDSAESIFGYAIGVGADVALNDRLYTGIEARFQGCPNQTFNLTSAGQALTNQTSTTTRSKILFIGLKVGVKY